MSDWIDVTKRLPERPGRYIVNIGTVGVTVADYHQPPIYLVYEGPAHRWVSDGEPLVGPLTHWMPLPVGPDGPLVARHPKAPNPFTSKIEVRECATLGTQWRDIWVDGRPWAIQVPAEAAKTFAAIPSYFGHVWHDRMLRGRDIERQYEAEADAFSGEVLKAAATNLDVQKGRAL